MNLKSNKRIYGWKPDVADHRDYQFKLAPPRKLPDHINRIGLSNPIHDQGDLGSCTGHASTSAMEIVTGISALSRLMAYYDGRLFENTVDQDAGAQIRNVIKGLQKFGVCVESLWPYDVTKFSIKPPQPAYDDGLINKQKIFQYNRILSLKQMKTALSKGIPVVFGFSVPESFESEEVAQTGWLPFPGPKEPIIGGHAVMACGYESRPNITKEPFIWVRNSWGSDWGIKGYFKMPYKWFTDPSKLTDDMWALVPTPSTPTIK